MDENQSEWIPVNALERVMEHPHLLQHALLSLGLPKEALYRDIGKGIGGGDGGRELRRDAVQRLLDANAITLMEEPTSPTLLQVFGSAKKFLETHGLRVAAKV
jgi:hypothetical protein